MHSPILAKRVYELKETQKGVELMCHEMEKIYSEGMESGEKRGELKKAKEDVYKRQLHANIDLNWLPITIE